jgi:polyisoprenoid-binding protein YceI
MNKRFYLSGILAILSTAALFAADTYQFDLAHSSVAFTVRHMVITNVRGNFKDFQGTILYDPTDVTKSSAEVTIKTASIDTDNTQRDNHLRSPDFFDAEKFPEITFKSKSVEKKGDGYVLNGTLSLRGVSKDVGIPFEILGTVKDPMGNTRLGAHGELSVNRMDYGVSWSKSLDAGGLVVSEEVKISLDIEAIKTNVKRRVILRERWACAFTRASVPLDCLRLSRARQFP